MFLLTILIYAEIVSLEHTFKNKFLLKLHILKSLESKNHIFYELSVIGLTQKQTKAVSQILYFESKSHGDAT